MGSVLTALSRRSLPGAADPVISGLVREYIEYPGDGYCEFEGDILVCVATLPRAAGGHPAHFELVRAVIALEMGRDRAYLYLDVEDEVPPEAVAAGRRPLDSREAFQAVLEYIYREYMRAIEAIGGAVDAVEDMVEREELAGVVRETYAIRRALIGLRRALRNYVQMLREIHSDQRMGQAVKNHGRLFELIDELSIGMETLEIYREVLVGIRETHASLVGLKLNEVVKRLTAITVVLMIPTLIASIYGMNFDRSYPLNMPELSWSFGYIYALALMAISSIAGYLVLKARGWF